MDQWAIYIDIEGFSATYEKGTQAMISLGALMEGVHAIGSRCYPETPYRLFAHQVGDGFVISGEFRWPDLKQPATVATALLRAVLHAGGVAKAAISEGQLADVLGDYPEHIQKLYARSYGGAFSMGGGLMKILPVMGTALINSVKLLHSSQTPSGSLLIVPKSQAKRLPAGVTFVEVGELCVLDWLHASYTELDGVIKMAQQVAPLDSPVLLLGETGTGKEVIANAIHYSSPRKEGPFIKVNCGAIPETLLDSELFGHEKGAFTGAISQRRGRFERADRGTIFLDEIGELPSQAQVRLLHVLQKKEIERVGGTSSIPVDIRIISATHRDLEEMIASGRFREDLWFRLNVFPIMIPPLRQRREDIPALVHHFIDRKSMELKLTERPVLAPGAINGLIAYDWPGNVRELENMIERALIQHRGGALSFETLLASPVSGGREVVHGAGQNRALPSLDEMNVQHIRRALEIAGGKINGPNGAGQILGLHPNTLRKRMNKLGIPFGRRSWQLPSGKK